MPSADEAPTPTDPRPVPAAPRRRNRYDALLSALTSGLLVVALAAVGWGVVAPTGKPAAAPPVQASEPVRLRIPSLRISAPVLPITLGTDAVLDPPEDPTEVGWWDASALPGATTGRVVITGHTLHQGDGALDRIVDLRRGGIELTTPTGTRRYEVTDRLVVDYTTVAERARDIFGQTEESPDGARLILVTCTDWNGSFYESNVIVVARPLPDRA